ncbi:MAG: right-handed parallel beta-helix repeat-containing protein [Myxococcales bacterium]|nr:right-handed parallel beta-helix repeat-containing protein [Myxococcales bacterium]
MYAGGGRARLVGLGALAVGLGLPAGAWAQDAATGVGVQTHATFQNVGVELTLTGDADRDATAALEVAVAGAGFRPAHRLSRVADGRFVGSAFFLPAGAAYEVRVTLADPDGVTNGTLTASGVTRAVAVPASTGSAFHVAPGGDDAADGSEATPFASIGRGLDAAQPGDSVVVHAGTYHEEITLPRGGTAGAPITLRAAGDGPVVMDGADPALLSPAAWSDEGGGLWSAPAAPTRYVAVDGVRLWRYDTLADLQALTVGTAGGFFHDGTSVHVRLPADAAPSGHVLSVASLARALWLEGTPHVVVSGLTFRCYGSEDYSEAVMVRDGSHGVWIVDSAFENVMPGIWVKGAVDDLVVMGNTFSDRGLPEFPWQAVKDQGGMESGAVSVDNDYDGQGIIFYRNVVHDSFDGLHICGDVLLSHPNNADVVANRFTHLGDDGLETDGECSNVRIVGNRFADSLVGVSAAPAVTGPTWILRNVIAPLRNVAAGSAWLTRALKLNVGDPRVSGEIFVYHNTALTDEAAESAFAITDDSSFTALHLANNIWVGTDYAFYYENTGDEPFTEDYDLFFSTGTRLIRHQGTSYDTVAQYLAATGLAEHGLAADPAFVDVPGGDLGLGDGSPAVDRGVVVPGVNDGFVGAGPDIGALELGAEGGGWPAGGSGAGASGGSASAPAGAEESSGGCGCRVSPARELGPLALLGLLTALGAVLARARRRAPSGRR